MHETVDGHWTNEISEKPGSSQSEAAVAGCGGSSASFAPAHYRKIMAAIRIATVSEKPVSKTRQARKLWQKIQNPPREPAQMFHNYRLDTLGQRDGRLKGIFRGEFEANKRSKKRTLKSGTDFLPSDDTEKESLFFSQRFSPFQTTQTRRFFPRKIKIIPPESWTKLWKSVLGEIWCAARPLTCDERV